MIALEKYIVELDIVFILLVSLLLMLSPSNWEFCECIE